MFRCGSIIIGKPNILLKCKYHIFCLDNEYSLNTIPKIATAIEWAIEYNRVQNV